ncbi:FemAB family XrtA/PEP-CTERM system-associated protein [Sedimenticola hydrogenitrophicus]|uniref:FemAB family XrtA/PEP-CTERM system-associated protein n=1 Tax=Sedimenticola hydrogenitrophicus TaxID=2967975 RepID=UPI0021A914E3|nr:FemAB family XrtA/PEP-CTERM system-associated protein [Sedimenticola hydrogenitrophicus]
MESTKTSREAITLHELDRVDYARWDRFVKDAADGTFFHLSGWKEVIEQAFGFKVYFFYTERSGQITGVLPLGHVKSVLFGNSLISLPFCVYGGVIAADDESAVALRRAACRLADTLGVDALELKNRAPSNQGWPVKELYVTFRKEISQDPEENLKAIPRKQRAMVRKGINAGLSSESVEGCDRFFHIYSESVRNLGTPVMPLNYFQLLREVFGNDCEVLMVTHEGKDIAGVMSFYFRDEVLPYYGGSIPLARNLKGNDFMYWELMRRCGERGIRVFDYGRSKLDAGSYSFKKNWGFSPEPLHYEYYLVKSTAVPEINPNNPKYQLLIKAWQKLPLPVANRIGPFLARKLG